MHLRAQQVLCIFLAVTLLAGENSCHGLRPQPQRVLLQGSSSSTAVGGTGDSAAMGSSTPGSASASSSASTTGGTATASASATPDGSSTDTRVSPAPSPPSPSPPRRPASPSPSPVPEPSPSEVEVDATLNETYVAIYLNIEERVDDGKSVTFAAMDEVRASRFKIAAIWGRVLGAVDGVDCQNETTLVVSQAKDFAQALANGLFEAKGSLENEDEIKETVAEMMEPALVEAVEAACGITGFTTGPEFFFALRLVDPVTEGYLLAGVGEQVGGSRPRSPQPSPDADNETSSSSVSTSMSADGETSTTSSSSTSASGETTTSTSTSTSGSGSATASASGSASASASVSGSASGSNETTTATTSTMTSTTTSRPTPPLLPASPTVVTSNGAGSNKCAMQFAVCCLQRKKQSGKCDCLSGRCDANYVDGVWEDVSGLKCTC